MEALAAPDFGVTLFQSEINGGSENQSSLFVGAVSDSAGLADLKKSKSFMQDKFLR